MGIFSILFIALALSMDTFAVALSIGVCKGMLTKANKFRYLTIIALFHFVMPVVGWAVGDSLHSVVNKFDHWLAFILLSFLGVKMILEGLSKCQEQVDVCKYTSFRNALIFGVALSIDAIIAGFSFGMTTINILNTSQFINILLASAVIGIIAFFVTWLGLKLGRFSGNKLGKHSEVVGGSVLILLGLKTLVEHLFI